MSGSRWYFLSLVRYLARRPVVSDEWIAECVASAYGHAWADPLPAFACAADVRLRIIVAASPVARTATLVRLTGDVDREVRATARETLARRGVAL